MLTLVYLFCSTIKGVMALEYCVLLLAFVPLFVIFLSVLKRGFVDVYERMKLRSSIAFTLFMIVMGLRLATYTFVQFSRHSRTFMETMRGEIPIYLTEILIALCYLKIIVSLYAQHKKKQE